LDAVVVIGAVLVLVLILVLEATFLEKFGDPSIDTSLVESFEDQDRVDIMSLKFELVGRSVVGHR
jgi:hypothetical protein